MLLDDDVVADGEAKAGALSSRFGREERIENLFLHARRDSSAVIANPNLHTIAKIFGRGSESRLVAAAVCFRSASAGDRNGPDRKTIAQYRNSNGTSISADRRQLTERV